MFPFGHGLSYGTFSYSGLAIDNSTIRPDGTVTVSVQVANDSDREAAEVVQLYLHQRHGSASRPVRELKGFQRVTVPAHGSQQVTFTVGPDARRFWSPTDRDWVLDSSVFDVGVGGDSTAELAASFEVTEG